MSRVKRGVVTRRRHNKILALAKGYRHGRHSNYRRALEAVMKAGMHAYVDRRKKKRDFRGLWITRMNAALRTLGMNYSTFVAKAKDKNMTINRKMMAELAIHEPKTFEKIVAHIK